MRLQIQIHVNCYTFCLQFVLFNKMITLLFLMETTVNSDMKDGNSVHSRQRPVLFTTSFTFYMPVFHKILCHLFFLWVVSVAAKVTTQSTITENLNVQISDS